jgi:hypothetical protein
MTYEDRHISVEDGRCADGPYPGQSNDRRSDPLLARNANVRCFEHCGEYHPNHYASASSALNSSGG